MWGHSCYLCPATFKTHVGAVLVSDRVGEVLQCTYLNTDILAWNDNKAQCSQAHPASRKRQKIGHLEHSRTCWRQQAIDQTTNTLVSSCPTFLNFFAIVAHTQFILLIYSTQSKAMPPLQRSVLHLAYLWVDVAHQGETL